MVENSENLPKAGKRNTRRTANLTPAQALEILQQSVINCQQAGIKIKFSDIYHQGKQMLVLTLEDCQIINGNLAINGTVKNA